VSDGVLVALDENEAVVELTAAMREADRAFEKFGGSTRHHVRDCLLPELEKMGLVLCRETVTPFCVQPWAEPSDPQCDAIFMREAESRISALRSQLRDLEVELSHEKAEVARLVREQGK